MKHIQLFEQFINEARAEVKLGRVTPKNIDEKAQQVLEVLQGAVGKTINGEELKKMDLINQEETAYQDSRYWKPKMDYEVDVLLSELHMS